MLSLRLLGSPMFLVDGAPLAGLRYPHGRKLLAYLALQGGRPVERTYLAGLFWPDTDEPRALFYLRRVLSDLRKALGDEADRLLAPSPRTLALNLVEAECDLGSGSPEELLQGWTDDWVLEARRAQQRATAPHSYPSLMVAPFLGREALLATVLALLKTESLVTLTGPGGVGKTRLARAVAQNDEGTVGFVPLASLPPESSTEEFLACVATALELPTAGLSLPHLAAQLKGRFSLVVLDNCEQVRDHSAALVAALPDIRFLATSRVPLACAAECSVRVPPLELEVATALFLELAAREGVRYPRDETVEAICQSVDCLPLALELAASRLKLMTPQQLRERLSAPLRLLRRSTGGGPPRQATLEATIQWSYDLLSARERDAFLRLGVFQGDWSLEDAEAVLETHEALSLLESLVSHSLVVAQRTATSVHFRFLETIRAFARTQYGPSSQAAAVAHARHFAFRLQRAAQEWLSPQQPYWVRWLETHQQELQVALSWLTQHDPLRGLELMVGLETFWTRQTGFPTRRYLHTLLQITEGQRTPLQSAQGLRTLAMVTPDDTQSRAILQQAHALALEHHLEQELAECALAACLQEKQRDLTALRRHAQEAYERYGRLGDLYGQAHALEYDAIAALRQGDMVGAERDYTHFLVLVRQLESPLNIWDAHYGLAQALLFQERLDEAEQTAAAAHTLLSQAPDKMSRANLLLLQGELARFKGRPDHAQAYYAESLQLCHENTIHVLPAFIERSRAIVFASTGNFPAAWASLQWALVEFRRYKISGQLGSTLAEMAWIAGLEGRHQEAALFAQQAQLAPPQDARYPHDQTRLQQALATKTKTPQEPSS